MFAKPVHEFNFPQCAPSSYRNIRQIRVENSETAHCVSFEAIVLTQSRSHKDGQNKKWEVNNCNGQFQTCCKQPGFECTFL